VVDENKSFNLAVKPSLAVNILLFLATLSRVFKIILNSLVSL